MREFLRDRGPLLQLVVGVLITAVAGREMIGKPARLVGLLTVGAGMFGAGIGLGLALARRRLRRP